MQFKSWVNTSAVLCGTCAQCNEITTGCWWHIDPSWKLMPPYTDVTFFFKLQHYSTASMIFHQRIIVVVGVHRWELVNVFILEMEEQVLSGHSTTITPGYFNQYFTNLYLTSFNVLLWLTARIGWRSRPLGLRAFFRPLKNHNGLLQKYELLSLISSFF